MRVQHSSWSNPAADEGEWWTKLWEEQGGGGAKTGLDQSDPLWACSSSLYNEELLMRTNIKFHLLWPATCFSWQAKERRAFLGGRIKKGSAKSAKMSWRLQSCERQKFNLKVFSLTSCTLLVAAAGSGAAAGFNRFQNWKKIRYSAALLLPHQLAAGLRPNGRGVEIKMDQSWKSLKWSFIGILPSSFSRSCSNRAEMQNKGFVTGILMLSQIEGPKYC